MKELDQYPYRISVTRSSYAGVQLTEDEKRVPEIKARRSLPSYLLFGHCSDESNPFDNMQKREFHASYASLHQNPSKMVLHQSDLFLDCPHVIHQPKSKLPPIPTVKPGRFVTTNQLLMPTPTHDLRHGVHGIDHVFRKSLEQNALKLQLRRP